MDQAFDSLGAYRKLGESGMPEPQAGATVEVVKDAMQNYVTKEFFTTELDRRFGAVDGKFTTVNEQFKTIDKHFEDIDKRFESIDKRFESIDRRFESIDRRFEAIDEHFKDIDKRFKAIDERFIKLEKGLTDLRVVVANSNKFMMATMLGTSLAVIGVQIALLTYLLGPLTGSVAEAEEVPEPPAIHQNM